MEWIVCGDIQFQSWINVFETEEEARKRYEFEKAEGIYEELYLCRIEEKSIKRE